MCTCLRMWHVLFSGVRLKFLFFREVKRFCFENAYECVRVCVCVCTMCVCVLVCAQVSEHVSCMCTCLLPFSALSEAKC